MNLKDVNKRLNYSKYCNNNIRQYNYDILKEQAEKGSTVSMKHILECWKSLNSNQDWALLEAVKVYKTYSENCKYESELNTTNKYVLEEVIPTINNMKTASNTFIENNLSCFINECNKYIDCDRVINNYNKIDKRFNIDDYFKRAVVNEYTIDEHIFNICEQINSLNLNYDIKFNAALESMVYGLYKNHKDYDPNYVLESVSDYFMFNIETDEDEYMMENVLLENNFIKGLKNSARLFKYAASKKGLKKVWGKQGRANQKFFFRNFGNIFKNIMVKATKTGDFDKLRPNLLKMVGKCKTMEDIKMLRKDMSIAKTSLNKLAKRKPEISKQIKDHIKWLNGEYRQAINDKAKTLKSSIKESLCDDSILDESWIDDFVNDIIEESDYIPDTVYYCESNNIADVAKTAGYTPEAMKKFVVKSYCKSPMQVIEGLPNLFTWIRKALVFATFAIHPIVGVLTLVVDKMIYWKVNKKYMTKVLNKFYSERKRVQKLYDNAKDGKIKEKYDKYLKELKISIDKLESEEDTFYYGDEMDAVYNKRFENESTIESEEDLNNQMKFIISLEKYVSDIDNNKDNIYDIIYKNRETLYTENLIEPLTELSLRYNDIIDPHKLSSIYNEAKNDVYKTISGNDKYKIASVLNENVYTLQRNEKSITENNDILKDTKELSEVLNEISFINTLKIAKDKLVSKIKNMSDKEKQISNTIDTTIDNFTRSADKALKSDNREAIIKGSIIPSASKLIKIGIGSSVLYFINPAIAGIAALGALGASKILRHKERQMILDEIDIELRMCKKKMQLADNSNDMKSLEQLMKIEKKLRRERQRIMYKNNYNNTEGSHDE